MSLTERERFAVRQSERARTEPWTAGIAVCYVCARDTGRCRYGMGQQHLDGDRLRGVARLDERHEGGPDVAHGGAIAAVLDEIAGNLVLSRGHLSVTKTLTVDYLAPVPLHTDLALESAVESTDGHRWTMTGSIALSGTVLARGRGVWVLREVSHWVRNRGAAT